MSDKDDDEVVEIVTLDDDQPTVAGTPVEVAELNSQNLMTHFRPC